MSGDANNANPSWSGMSVRYQNAPEDLVMLYEYSVRSSWSFRFARIVGTTISLAFAGYVLLLVIQGRRDLDTAFFVLFAASLVASLGRDAVKRTVRRNVEELTRAGLRPRHLRIDRQGMWFDDQPELVGWERVRAVISNEHVIMVFFDNSAEVVPTRVFQDPFEAATFAELAREFRAEFGQNRDAPAETAPQANPKAR